MTRKLARSILEPNNFPTFLALVIGIVSIPLLVASVYSPRQTVSHAQEELSYRNCLEQVRLHKTTLKFCQNLKNP